MAIGKSKLHELLKRGQRLDDFLVWATATRQHKHLIIDYIQKDQLEKDGVDGTGRVIGQYSFMTEVISKGKKQEGDNYTLNDTGAFFKSMYVTVGRDKIMINADPRKGEDNLFEKYGSKIIGLTNENFERLKGKILEAYQVEFRRILFGRK